MDSLSILETLKNDSFDLESLTEALRDASVRNFNTLYEIQQKYVGITRLEIPFQEFERITKLPIEKQSTSYPKRYIYYTGIDMVKTDKEFRYHSSPLYGQMLSQKTISENPDIFKCNFMIFIDGYYISTAEVVISDDESAIIIDVDPNLGGDSLIGISAETFKKYYDNNYSVVFMTVPMMSMGIANLNKPTFDLNNGSLNFSRFTNSEEFNENTLFLINTTSDVALKKFVKAEVKDDAVLIPTDITLDSVKLEVIGINLPFLWETRHITKEDEWFILEGLDLPVPITNIVPLLKDGQFSTLDHNVSIDIYYPNIYHINGITKTDNIDLMIFYSTDTNDSAYKNKLEMLHYATANVVKLYKDGSLPEFLKTYKPVDIRWFNSDNYTGSLFYPNKPMYNVSKLQEYADQDEDILIKYLYLKLRDARRYYINVSKINLAPRLRKDSKIECEKDGILPTYFSNNRYVFSLRKKFIGNNDTSFRLFIDNLFIPPSKYSIIPTFDFFHFYIPTEYIKSNSMIEIERYPQYNFEESFQVESTTEKKQFTVPTSIINKMPVQDINIIKADNGVFLPSDDYKIFVFDEVANAEIEINPVGRYVLTGKYSVMITDEKWIGVPLKIYVNHRVIDNELKFVQSTSLQTIEFDNLTNVVSDKVRLFRNGLCLPEKMYLVNGGGQLGKPTQIMCASVVNEGDSFFVDVLPNTKTCEFSQKYITDPKGLVDTGGQLSLPLDLRWYDIYVNGMKLNKNNVEIITSSKFYVKNINSARNLYIYTRGTYYEEFKINTKDTLSNLIYDSVDEIQDYFERDKEVIQDTARDILEDLIEGQFDHIMFVWTILQYTFINPNTRQLNEDIENQFPDLFDEHKIMLLDCNTYPSADLVTEIDSNKRSDVMKNDQYRYAFTPLHVGNHEDALYGEYMCDPITGSPGMKMRDGTIISIGELDRKTNHKNAFQQQITFQGVDYSAIYMLECNENTVTKEIVPGNNILDESVTLGTIENILFSIDADILETGMNDVRMFSQYNPTFHFEFLVGTETETHDITYNELKENPIKIGSSDVVLNSISMVADPLAPSTLKCILHSILVAI